MKDLISIIVPIYNVGRYLEQCLISILEQTYRNLEIILIDDGSTDTSGAICDSYQKNDDRIKVIHQKNGGLSRARNVGIKLAQGTYLAFVDSDDWIEKDYIEKMYEACKSKEADICVCNFEKVWHNKNKSIPIKAKVYDENVMSIMFGQDCTAMTVAWNKLYKKELWKEIVFTPGKIHEDESTTYKVFYKAKRIVVINEILYHYRMLETSITRKKI